MEGNGTSIGEIVFHRRIYSRVTTAIPYLTLCAVFLCEIAEGKAPDNASEIRPILSDRCFKCHGPSEAEADLRFDQRDSALLVIDPDDVEASEFYYRITTDYVDDRMPPKKESKTLTDQEKDLLVEWMKAGAPYERHWAYVNPEKKENPSANLHPIDGFVHKRLAEAGLDFSPLAEPGVLLRRLSFDLTGLPPTADELENFLADPSMENYERQVNRLLASPAYGERWARWWLDIARYADTNGFQHDEFRSVWPYRDWVIRSFNEDMPFDQFTVEQLAGDLLPDPTIDQLVATAFNRNAPTNCSGGIPIEESQVNILHDRVATLGTVWLGTTLECAQCHDHKFDPVAAEDYYSIFAYFNDGVDEIVWENPKIKMGKKLYTGGRVQLPIPREQEQVYNRLREALEDTEKLYENAKQLARKNYETWEDAAIASGEIKSFPSRIRAMIEGEPRESRNPATWEQIYEFYYSVAEESKEIHALYNIRKTELLRVSPPESLAMEDLPEERNTYILERGNYLTPGRKVGKKGISAFHPLPPGSPNNRLGLAYWIISPDNPLMARVTVNRLWNEIFGRGIVTTTEDFGFQSAPPSHPALLDWLAVEFSEKNWSVKNVLKQIVLSRAYRQSSNLSEKLLRIDPENKLLARGPRFRLSAEAIRDNALHIAGLLSDKMFGPPVHPPQPDGLWSEIQSVTDGTYDVSAGEDRYRRGLYTVWRRGAPNPTMLTFDAPRRDACVTRRERSNSPLQALTLLNDPVFVEAAEAFGERLEGMEGSPSEKLRKAFGICTARFPSEEEHRILLAFYQHQSEDSTSGRSAWFHVAQVLMNLDETITKE